MARAMNIPCDVVVAGGGVAGALAAAASARSGARTVLVEERGYLGGIGVAGLLHHICGLYLNGGGAPPEMLNSGIISEVIMRLSNLSPRREIERIGKVFVLPYSPEALRKVLELLCLNEPNLTLLQNTTVVSLQKEAGRIVEVTARNGETIYCIKPGAVIDCTGNGAVSVMAGASFELSSPKELQMAGYSVLLKGIAHPDESLPIKIPYYLSEAATAGFLPPHLKFTIFSSGAAPDEGYCKFSMNGTAADDCNEKAEAEARKALDYLKEKIPSLRAAVIVETSQGVMEREGRRIYGEYTLTEADVLNAAKFPDGAVKNAWPVELWDRERGTIYKYVPSGDYYEIPFRCMKVKNIPNLLCAGRCISVSHEALGSTRVMGACMALGEQAGRAAAYYAAHGAYQEKG